MSRSVTGMRRAAVAGAPMPADVMRNVLERQPRRIFPSPIRQSRTDRLGIFESWNIVAAKAAILGDRFATDVLQPLIVCQPRLAVPLATHDQVLLGAFQLALQLRRNTMHVVLVRNILVKRLVEVFEDQLL